MNMKALGIILLAICTMGVALTNVNMTEPVYAHALLALSPSPEPPTFTSVPPPPAPSATDTPQPSQPSSVTPPPDTTPPTSPPPPTDTSPPGDTNRPKADLVITKQANTNTAVVGQVIDFTITVTNKGNGPAGNVVVIDNLPAFLELVNVTVSRGVVAVNGSKVEVTLGEVTAGEVVTITISARAIAAATSPNDRNVAELITSSTSDKPDDNNASTEVQVVPATPVPTVAAPLPTVAAPLATRVPPPASLPPTGSGEGLSSVWLLAISILAILLGFGLRRARRSL